MLYGDMFMNLKTIDEMNNTDDIISYGSWERVLTDKTIDDDQYTSTIVHKGGNDPLMFSMIGNELYIHTYGAYHGTEEEPGEPVVLVIKIDGKTVIEITESLNQAHLITDQLSDGKHTVSITVKNPSADNPFIINLINYQ